VTTARKEVYTCDFLIYATGNAYRHLDVPGEDRFSVQGVSYCATCDGNFFRWSDVIVVGGGDSSFTEALYLAHLCKTVKILVRKDKAKAEEIWVKKVQEEPNMEIIYNTEVAEINGQFAVESVTTKDGRTIPTQGILSLLVLYRVLILIKDLGVEIDEEGCIKIDQHQKSSFMRGSMPQVMWRLVLRSFVRLSCQQLNDASQHTVSTRSCSKMVSKCNKNLQNNTLLYNPHIFPYI
jgi:thioredoxin reductase (NADPH)